ncbi:MAG: phosphoglucomutase/phosphomannomutase family protein [Candidatus Omnitrophica bacterium]|nr:phosphoglucomutase/phosphomannomutase family protein [Candidatus Omnitrophota bacterium]
MSISGTQIKFGTDGWRGVIGDVFTFENVGIVSQAIAEWITHHTNPVDGVKSVCIGYDNRFLSQEFAEIVSCVFAANGIKVILSDTSIPTPALSFGVTRKKSVAGIMITASHNPGKFNGIKIKTAQGGAAGKDITDVVESFLHKTPVKKNELDQSKKDGSITLHDFKVEYVKFIRNYVDFKKIKSAKFKVIQDVMHGSGRDLMQQILKGTQIRLELIRTDVNPSFEGGKPEPVAEYLQQLIGRMKKEKWDLGLVLDGDADRVAAVEPGGKFISPQKILGLLILHLVRNRGLNGGVVKTLCGTTMIDHIAKKLNLKLYETPVGFKYISDLMVTQNIVAGGEEAGGMGLPNYIPERDGSLSGLLLLEMMVYQKKNIKQLLEQMEKEFGAYFYERLDLTIDRRACDLNKIKTIPELLGKKVVNVKDFDGVKLTCADESWLMFRPSGTEPLVRIYSEAKSLKKAKDLIAFGRKFLEAAL